jgi:hypothetical protein
MSQTELLIAIALARSAGFTHTAEALVELLRKELSNRKTA